MADLNLVVSEERVKEVPLDTFYGLTAQQDPGSMVDYIAHFVTVDGEYVPKEVALPIIFKGRTLGDLEEIASQLQEAMEGMAVPNM